MLDGGVEVVADMETRSVLPVLVYTFLVHPLFPASSSFFSPVHRDH